MRLIICASIAALASTMSMAAQAQVRADASLKEDYIRAELPPGFQVVYTELEGPVYADQNGKTLYKWPYQSLRNGYVGDEKGKSVCTDKVSQTSAGLMSPYPPGLVLPNLDTRPSCTQMWPPALAGENAQPVGKWTFITREDGSRQWAYEGQALYTSAVDVQAGDVLGGTSRSRRGMRHPAAREPIRPLPNVPPGFMVVTTFKGRMLVNREGYSVYVSDKDTANASNCDEQCTQVWKPVLAPALAKPQGEWSVIQRAPGVLQWAFRSQPLYTYARDIRLYTQKGSDEPGWHNVYTQLSPAIPDVFQLIDTQVGVAVGNAEGKTVYAYTCADDALDQLSCDYPGEPNVYRLAICGGGNVDRCLKRWPYVTAAAGATSNSRAWSIITIDPRTGHLARPDAEGALRVWAYRGRPLYTYERDAPGDIKGNAMGEWSGMRNGFIALWVREDFAGNDT